MCIRLVRHSIRIRLFFFFLFHTFVIIDITMKKLQLLKKLGKCVRTRFMNFNKSLLSD